MKKQAKKRFDISYLELFKKSIALSFSFFVFGAQTSYASTITGDKNFNTNVSQSGNNINISGGIAGGSNTNILHFYDFNLSQGDIANLIMGFGVDRYVGLVDKQIIINGILNSIKNGTIGGDVMFVSPEGMLVGSSGIVNMGSLQLVTPNQNSYNAAVAKGSAIKYTDVSRLKSDSTTSETGIYGKIFTSGTINIADANKITLGETSDIVSGFNAKGFEKTRYGDLSGIVNTSGIVDSQYMSGSTGKVQLVAKNISSENLFARDGLIQSTGTVTINTPSTTGTEISLTSKIQADGNVTIGNLNESSPTESTTSVDVYNSINSGGKITINGDSAYIGEDADLTANKAGGTVETNTRINLTLNSDITANAGVTINSQANFEQGNNSKITNTGTGNINLKSVNITQGEGASITNQGAGYIKIDSPGFVSLRNIDAQNGNIDISTAQLTLNDEISSSGDINIKASKLEQTSNDFTALNAGNDIIINTTSGSIGTEDQSINMSAKGDVSLDTMAKGGAYIHGTGENDLTIAKGTNLTNLNATSDRGINITGNIASNGDINLDATTGINQNANTTVTSYTGDVNYTNSTSGDIKTGTITSARKDVNITNNAVDGSVLLNNLISAQNGGIDIKADKNITQGTTEKTLQAKNDINLTATNGDIGTNDKRVIFSTDSTFTASAGKAVNVEGENTNIDLSNITAGTDYNLATTGEGEIIIGGAFHNENGSIELETEKQLNVTDDITAAGDITLSSSNGIVQTEGTRIESGTGEADSGNINITNKGQGGITINSATANKGGITVSNTETATGDVNVGGLTAEGGDINVTNNAANGDIMINDVISTDSNIEMTANRNILQNESLVAIALNAQNNIDLVAQNGSVGAGTQSIYLNSGNIVNASGSDIYLLSPDADLKTGVINATNNVDLVATNYQSGTERNIILTDLVSGNNVDIWADGSVLQQTDDASQKVIDARGDLYITAQKGDIGNVTADAVNAINFSSKGVLSANAENGSIALNGIDTSIDTSDVNAGKNLDLITTNTGNITVSNEQNVTGHINLNSAENIALNKSIAASDDITLTAKGDITQGADLTGTALSSQKNITITAANAGTADKAIIVDAQGVVNAGTEDFHAGNLYLEDNTGDFTIGQMFADNNLSLKAQGNIVQADGSAVGINSTGNVTLSSESGNIGASDSALKLNISGENSSFNVEKSQNVYVESPNSDLNTGNINADQSVNISTTGSGGVNLNGLIKSNDVNIHAIDSIVQNKNIDTKTIEAAGNLQLISDTGDIGATGENGSAIKFSSSTLEANAQQGSVYLNGIGTTINATNITAKKDIDLTTTDSGNINVDRNITAEGHIKLDAADELNLNGSLTADDYVDITANGGDIVFSDTVTAGTDINVKASGNIYQNVDDTAVLNAGNNINLDAGQNIGQNGSNLIINANGTVTAKAGNAEVPVPGFINLESQQKINAGTISANGAVNIKTSDSSGADINLTDKISGTDVTIDADGNITQNISEGGPDRSIEATGDLRLIANTGSIGQTGNAVDFSAEGNLFASAANGSVVLNGIDTDINTSSITAKNDIDLSTENTGKITVSDNITTNDGYIRLNSAESLEINKNLIAGKYIELAAHGGIIQNETNAIIAGTNGASTSADGYVSITNQNGGDVTLKNVAAKGDITITNEAPAEGSTATGGNITLGSITSASESVSVYNNIVGKDIILENLVTAAKDIDLNTTGNISQTGAGLALDAGNNITLAGADIGSDQNYIKLNANGSVGANGNNIYLESTNKDFNISGINSDKETADGTIKLTTTGSGNIQFQGLVKGGNITVDAAQGISQDAGLTGKAIDASSDLTLKANDGSIGSKDSAQGGALKFSAGGDLNAEASQAVVLNGIDTDIKTSSITAGTDIDLKTTIDKDDTKGNIIVNNALNATNGYVSLDSAKGLDIKQNISSADYIRLNAQNGNIDINSAVVSDSYIDIDANGNITHSGGSLVAKGQNAEGTGIDIDATGDITLKDLTAQNGKITVNNSTAGKNIILSGLLDAGAHNVEISSLGSISQTTADTSVSTGSNVILNAGENIGSDTNSLLINADGTITADGNDVYLGSKDKNLNIAGINSAKADANGTVKLTTDTGNIHLSGLVKGGNITMDSALDISQDAGLSKSIDGENINLTTRGGGIGSDGNALDISVKDTGRVDADSAGDVYLNSPEGDLTTGTITANNHKVDINSEYALKLDGLIKANDVILTAVNNITQDASLNKSIEAVNVNLTSTTGSIGEAASGDKAANAIDFSATGTLNATATNTTNGSIVLNGVNTSITTDSINAGKNIDLSTTGAGSTITVSNPLTAGGYISLNSADGLIMNGDLTAVDYVSLAAQKDILLNHIITAGTDISVNAAGKITQDEASNNTVLNAGRDINLVAGNDIGLSTKSILLNANGTVSAQGQNIYLDSPNKDLNISKVTSTNNGTVRLSTTGGGTIYLGGLVKGGDVAINSAKGITQDASLDKSIEADGSLVLNAADGDIGEAKQGDVPANAIDFSAGSVEAHADKGSVVLNGVESNINTSSITALNNIDLTTTTSGTITVASDLETTNGYINLNSADDLVLNENVTSQNSSVSLGSQNGNITLNSIVTAGTDLNVDAHGNIIQQTTDTALNASQNININATGDAGSESNSLLVNAGGEVNADAQNVYLEDKIGDFTIGEINAANYLKLTAEGNLLQSDPSKTAVSAGTSADLISKNGSIGTSSQSIKTAGGVLVNAQAQNGSAYLASEGDFEAGNINVRDTAQINSLQNINLNGLIKANETNLTAENNITQVSDGKSIESTGGNINLLSNSGNIGTPNGNAIGFSLQGSGVINADASNNGSVVLKGIDSNINTNTIKAKNDIDLTTTGTGNITVSDNLNAGGYIRLDSANALTLDKNLTADQNIDLFARNGDITINSVLNAGTDIAIDASGAVLQTIADTALTAANDISINAGADIGSNTQSITLNAGGTVSADGNNIYLASPDADLTTGVINAKDSAHITSGENLIVNNNITAQNSVELDAAKGISQNAASTISSANNNISITAHNGDLNLDGSVTSRNGAVAITNYSTGDHTLRVNKLSAGTKFDIRHDGNGLLTVNGSLNNNGNSTVTANSTGSNAGILINGTINNNKGSLNIESQGQQGTTIKGNINNDLVNDGGSTHSDITIHNHNGALNVDSAKIDNGKNTNSQNTITFINDGAGGTNITSDITNKGILNVTNNAGAMNLSGALNAELGSQNNFTNGSDNDFNINSAITNKGTDLNFYNTGAGNLILGENAFITVYSVLDGGNIYTGRLNLSNSGSNGKIQIDGKISGLEAAPAGSINIENSANGANSGIVFGETASIDAKNNSVNIENTGAGGIQVADGVAINSSSDISISNQNSGSIDFGDNAQISGSKIDIENSASNGGILFGQNASVNAGQALDLTNSGSQGISFKDNATLSAGTNLTVKNTNTQGGIDFGNGSTVSSNGEMIVDNAGVDGIVIKDNTSLTSKDKLTLKNTGAAGITINGTAKGKDVYVENNNSNVNIAHNKLNGNLIADNYLSVNVENGSIVNTSTAPENADNLGIVSGAGMDLNATGGSIGVLDNTLNNIIQDGFVLDPNNAIHINAGGKVNATATNDINLKSINKDLNIGTLSGKDVLLSSINGAINADSATTNNLYLYAKGNNGSINIKNLTSTGFLTTESDYDTTIQSNAALNANSMLSKNGSIKIDSEGNTYINEIAAANDITITVEDEKLTINDLGRVDRDKTVIPKTVNLTVKDAKRPNTGTSYRPGMSYDDINNVQPNSKLDIYNAYVQDKVTMKADTITAQVYDISDGSTKGQIRVDANGKEATGFHNANQDGKLLEFDIQGANYAQDDVGSDPNNPYYTPDANDKHALNVHLTIGDSVNGAELGANFKKLYSDYAFVDTVVSDQSAFSTIVLESGIIGEKAIFRNNKYRVDVNNTDITQDYPINKHYDDEVDSTINNKTSFNLKMADTIEIDVKPGPPVNPVDINNFNDPNKIVRVPTIDSLTKEPDAKGDDNSAVNSDKATSLRNIAWVVRNTDNDVIGASEQIAVPVIKSLVGISQKGILVTADTLSDNAVKKDDILHIQMKKDDASFNIDGKVKSINGNLVEISFLHPDKLTKNIMLFWCMEQENL